MCSYVNDFQLDGLRCPTVDVDALATSTACCVLDLSSQNLIRSSVGVTEHPL